VLQTIHAAVHWPLLVAASVTLLAARRFPSNLVPYAARAEALVRRFLERRKRPEQSPRSRLPSQACALEELHASFKALDWPDSAASYHWCVSEAMRHDIEALAFVGDLRLYQSLRAEAGRYWRRAQLHGPAPRANQTS
jgi:hypothetical protein